MLVGGNPNRGSYEEHIEIYSPAYLFNANGTPATRPTIGGVTPGAVGYGHVFQVDTPVPSSIASVVLVRPGAPTHAFDMEQRLVGLSFTVSNGVLNVTSPPNGNIAPPGYYMLFLLDTAGVPSVARFVRLSPSITNQRPTAIINSPPTDITVSAGNPVFFSGSGTDPDGSIAGYSWTFPGGSPTSSSAAAPGNVVYSTPGTYTASLTVTDNGGLSSASPATRTVVVNNAPPDTTPPTVSMTAPANNSTVSGSVTVSANANDNTGVVGVQFLLGGVPLGAEDTTAPYSVTWNSTSVANGGPYQLSARARDAASLQTTATAVSVTVNNTNLGLVAAYAFNAGTGTTLADQTGTGHTGTITGATWTTQGRFGAALNFDGVNDWVTVNDANDLDFTTGMTLEAWVYPTASGGGSWRNVLIKERAAGEAYNLYANADTDAPVMYVVAAAQPGQPVDARGSAALLLNTWTHLATTYDGTTLRLFVNGTQVASRAIAGPLLTSTGVLRFGGNGVWGEFFAGRIDEVRLYNRALAVNEIQADMNAPVQP
jgi:PKD repeat protein